MPYTTLLFADAHLRDRRGDEQFALTQIVDAAVANKVSQVVAAGDLIDRQTNRAGPIAFWYAQIDRLEAADIAFYYTQGQHDYDEPPWLSGHRWASHLHGRLVSLGPHRAYGLDFQPACKLQEALAAVPADCNMLIAHQVWGDWMGDIAAPQGDFADIPGHVEVLFSGDLHQARSEKVYNVAGRPVHAVSPGATCQLRVNEPDEHYYVLLDERGTLSHRKLRSRVFVNRTVITAAEAANLVVDLDDALGAAERTADRDDYPPELRKPVVRVTYHARYTDVARHAEHATDGRAHLILKELPAEERRAAVRPVEPGEAVTPLSVLADEGKDSPKEAVALVARLLQSNDQAGEFARWRSEFMGSQDAL